MTEPAGIVIVGSLNMDLVVRVGGLPQPGQTVSGSEFKMLPGGKGANQAYTVARLGGRGALIGCVGDDLYAEQLRASLQSAGVNLHGVRVIAEASTGVALITVEQSGQNQIVIAGGANHCLQPGEVVAALAASDARYLLLQLESPLATVEAAATAAQAKGMTVVLDPAPAQPLPSSLLGAIDILTPNESEALTLLGLDGNAIELAQAAEIAQRLLLLGPRRIILKLGEKGVWLADREQARHFPTQRVDALDTTAAGDCFNGALAVALAEGKTIEQAIAFANCAAALSVTRFGAQASIPTRAEVNERWPEK